jgi:dipeptide/tripeptide permease
VLHCFRKWRSSFFNWFYFVINIGSLVASTVVVGVQETKGYGIGFGIPTIFFAVVRQDLCCVTCGSGILLAGHAH